MARQGLGGGVDVGEETEDGLGRDGLGLGRGDGGGRRHDGQGDDEGREGIRYAPTDHGNGRGSEGRRGSVRLLLLQAVAGQVKSGGGMA